MKKIVLLFLIYAACIISAMAEAVSLTAMINAPRISLDQVLQLTLTVTGVNNDLDPISLPVLDGFTAKYLGPSSSVTIINGDYHSERSFVYNLFPNKVGRFQIPSITATISGQTFTTKPINVEVVQTSSQLQGNQPTPDKDQGVSLNSLKDKILITVTVNKTDAYLDERIPVSIKLLVNGVPVRDIQYPQFDKSAFAVDDFDKPVQNSELINGIKYDSVEFKTNIYPKHLGVMLFGPVQIQGNVLYKTGQNNPFNQDNSPFSTDIFNSFFDAYANRPIVVTSKPVKLQVSALPQDNEPQDFSGAIGQFDFVASISPARVKVGDPVTLKMDVQGVGNFKNLKLPAFNATGFKSYAPQIKNATNEKMADVVIIPGDANIKEVPAIHFSYFDTASKSYKTITQGPFPLQVMMPSPDQEFKAVGFSDISHTEALAVSNEWSWHRIIQKVHHFFQKVLGSKIFWICFLVSVLLAVIYGVWRAFKDKLEHDPAFARKIKAVKEARQALVPAEDYKRSGRYKDFYALLSKVLRDFLANKWHQSSAALSIPEIVAHLSSINVDKESIKAIQEILEQSDLVCFAGATKDSSQMTQDLTKTQDLITHLGKFLK